MNGPRLLACGVAFMLVSVMMPCLCRASHPNHVSSAEVKWNPKSGNFEVALCVWPTDLEKALGADQAKSIDLDKVENLDELMKSYIQKRFLVRASKSGNPRNAPAERDLAKHAQAIRWVGHERDNKAAWLYFEVVGDKQEARWTVENRVFFELNEDQLNQVEMTIGRSSRVAICRLGESSFKLDTANASTSPFRQSER